MADSTPPWSDRDVPPLTTQLVMELEVTIGAPVTIGESAHGLRRFIPIQGGTFTGRDMRGEVIPGGADWQLTRPDGITEVKAVYAIRTDDGQVISVDNRGIVAPPDAMSEHAYVRTTPTFDAPTGRYDWLNRRIFSGTIRPSPERDYVTVLVFQIM